VHHLITFCQEMSGYMGPVTGCGTGLPGMIGVSKGVKRAHSELNVSQTQVKPVGKVGGLLVRVSEVHPFVVALSACFGKKLRFRRDYRRVSDSFAKKVRYQPGHKPVKPVRNPGKSPRVRVKP